MTSLRMFELFQKYGRHSLACEQSDGGRVYKGGEMVECPCGFAQAVAALPSEDPTSVQSVTTDPPNEACCSFCDRPVKDADASKQCPTPLLKVKDRFFICPDCVEDAQGCINEFWDRVYEEAGEREYRSWFV